MLSMCFAFVGTLICLWIHAATIFKLSPSASLNTWVIWMIVLVVPLHVKAIMIFVKQKRKVAMARVFAQNAKWLRILMYIGVVYGILLFFITEWQMESGAPEIMDGRMVLSVHGHIIRELSEIEYERFTWYEDWTSSFVILGLFYLNFMIYNGLYYELVRQPKEARPA